MQNKRRDAKIPDGKRSQTALRDIEKAVQKDLDDGIRTNAAEKATVDELFRQFMNIREPLNKS